MSVSCGGEPLFLGRPTKYDSDDIAGYSMAVWWGASLADQPGALI